MTLILKRKFGVFNGKNGRMTTLPEGRHKIERIPCPYGRPGMPWLVLSGTKTGATEIIWKSRIISFGDLVAIEN